VDGEELVVDTQQLVQSILHWDIQLCAGIVVAKSR